MSFLLFSQCNTDGPITQSGVNVESQTIALSLALPCSQGAATAQDSLSTAIAIITGSDMDTIFSNLTIEPCKITGLVKNIPTGIKRSLDLKIYNARNQVAYFGTAIFDVQQGKSIDVVLKLQRNVGSINIIGVICDTVIENYADVKFVPDYNTLALYHFNEDSGNVLFDATNRWPGILKSGERIKGAFGNALKFSFGNSARFDTIIPNNTPNGTLELYLMFDNSPKSDSIYLIFGNDASRCNFYYRNGYLIFLKGHNDIFKYVEKQVNINANTWYHVAGTWGSKGMRLFVNDSLIVQNQDTSVYQSSYRSTEENVFKVGDKTYCCMNGVGIYRPISVEASIDEIRISNVERY
jgi:hypothetical protein